MLTKDKTVVDNDADHINNIEGSRPLLESTAQNTGIYLRRGLGSQRRKRFVCAIIGALWAVTRARA